MVAYLFIARIRVLTALAYRFEVFASMLGGIIVLASGVFIWGQVMDPGQTAAGVDRTQMLTYTVMAAVLGAVLQTQIQDTINQRVQQGQIAVDLLRPCHPLLMWFAEDAGNALSSLVVRGLPFLVFGWFLTRSVSPASPAGFSLFLLTSVLSFLILWMLSALVAMVAFWVLELGGLNMVKDVLVRFLSGAFVPIWFFPEPLQRISPWLPFIYIYQAPLGLYVGRTPASEGWRIAGIQSVWVILLGALLVLIWSKARTKVLLQGG